MAELTETLGTHRNGSTSIHLLVFFPVLKETRAIARRATESTTTTTAIAIATSSATTATERTIISP